MPRKLTKKELEFLKELSNDKELKFKGFLKRFIIGNTYKPKYKVGDYVKVYDSGHYIYGNPCTSVNAKIVEIGYMIGSGIELDNICVQYECVAYDQFGNDHTLFVEESVNGYYEKRHIIGLSNTDQNTFEKKSKYSDSCPL